MTHALPLLLALAFASDPAAAAPEAGTVESHVLGHLTATEAALLEGKREHYQVAILTSVRRGGFGPIRCTVIGPGGVAGELLLEDLPRRSPLTVEAELRMEFVPAGVGRDGTPFSGRWRYRLENAAVVGEP
jgi:hypothetical protein